MLALTTRAKLNQHLPKLEDVIEQTVPNVGSGGTFRPGPISTLIGGYSGATAYWLLYMIWGIDPLFGELQTVQIELILIGKSNFKQPVIYNYFGSLTNLASTGKRWAI